MLTVDSKARLRLSWINLSLRVWALEGQKPMRPWGVEVRFSSYHPMPGLTCKNPQHNLAFWTSIFTTQNLTIRTSNIRFTFAEKNFGFGKENGVESIAHHMTRGAY